MVIREWCEIRQNWTPVKGEENILKFKIGSLNE